jgi:hypothetical protein
MHAKDARKCASPWLGPRPCKAWHAQNQRICPWGKAHSSKLIPWIFPPIEQAFLQFKHSIQVHSSSLTSSSAVLRAATVRPAKGPHPWLVIQNNNSFQSFKLSVPLAYGPVLQEYFCVDAPNSTSCNASRIVQPHFCRQIVYS